MPKKTKKEKILADQRRKSLPPLTSRLSLPIANPQPQTSSLYIYPVQLIRKDLTKTLLLCILAISLEIALYLILEKNLNLPFKIK